MGKCWVAPAFGSPPALNSLEPRACGQTWALGKPAALPVPNRAVSAPSTAMLLALLASESDAVREHLLPFLGLQDLVSLL